MGLGFQWSNNSFYQLKGGFDVKDEWGRSQNRAQAIREFSTPNIAVLLNDIVNNPDKYPKTEKEWIRWLLRDSGNAVKEL